MLTKKFENEESQWLSFFPKMFLQRLIFRPRLAKSGGWFFRFSLFLKRFSTTKEHKAVFRNFVRNPRWSRKTRNLNFERVLPQGACLAPSFESTAPRKHSHLPHLIYSSVHPPLPVALRASEKATGLSIRYFECQEKWNYSARLSSFRPSFREWGLNCGKKSKESDRSCAGDNRR